MTLYEGAEAVVPPEYRQQFRQATVRLSDTSNYARHNHEAYDKTHPKYQGASMRYEGYSKKAANHHLFQCTVMDEMTPRCPYSIIYWCPDQALGDKCPTCTALARERKAG